MTGLAPEIPTTTSKLDQPFPPNDTSKFFSAEAMEKWNDFRSSVCLTCLMASPPPGLPGCTLFCFRYAVSVGFQWISDTDKYHGLPNPIRWPEKTVFTTSITHWQSH